MKATLTTTFTESQLKQLFNSLTIPDCKRAISFLQKRIEQDEAQKHLKKGGIRKWDDEFLKMKIEEFDLHPWTLIRLRENQLFTVRDITEFGIENLAMLRRVGKRITDEIKREIFNTSS